MRRKLFVLSIEGGGCAGILPSHFLSFLPSNQQTLDIGCDRLILSGCSIGAVLAAAYASGKMFSEVDACFQKRAKDCFQKRLAAKVNPLACPTYKNSGIDAVMHDMMGDVTLGDVKNIFPHVDIVIPALDVSLDKPVIFTTLNHDYDDVKLMEIAGFSSCAPTYYAGREFRGSCLVDFGILDVSSIMTAVTTVKRILHTPFCDMRCLLIGSGDDIDDNILTTCKYNDLGLIGMLKQVLVPYITLSNKTSTKQYCEALGFNWFNYWNPVKTTKALDDTSQIPELVVEADKHKDGFLDVWNEWLNG